PLFIGASRAGVQVVPILVHVGKDDSGIVLEPVEDAVAVVGIDVHVGNALEAEPRTQPLDGNAAVVEYTESCGLVAGGVMQAGDGDEPAPGIFGHDGFGGIERRADDY